MHPLTCYAGQISLCHAKTEKISEKIFVMIDKDGGGGEGSNFWILLGGHSCYEGGHRAHGGSPQSPPPLSKTLCHLQKHLPEDETTLSRNVASLKNMIQGKTHCSFESIQHTESTNLNIFRKMLLFYC